MYAIYTIKTALAIEMKNNNSAAFHYWITEKSKNGWYGTEVLSRLSQQLENEGRDPSILPVKAAKFNGLDNVNHFSITELVHTFDIPRDTVEELFERFSDEFGFDGTLDLDAIYSADWNAEYYKTTNPLDVDMQYLNFLGKVLAK